MKCDLCGAKVPDSEAIASGWEPSYYFDDHSGDEGGPVCPKCIEERLEDTPEGLVLKPAKRELPGSNGREPLVR